MDTRVFYAIKGNKQIRITGDCVAAYKAKGYDIHEAVTDNERKLIAKGAADIPKAEYD